MPRWSLKPLVLRLARSIFSRMLRLGQVPLVGSWKTLPKVAALLYSDFLVMFSDFRRISPLSMKREPQIRLRRVVFPEPLEPTMEMNSFSWMVKEKSSKACFWLICPRLKILLMWFN